VNSSDLALLKYIFLVEKVYFILKFLITSGLEAGLLFSPPKNTSSFFPDTEHRYLLNAFPFNILIITTLLAAVLIVLL